VQCASLIAPYALQTDRRCSRPCLRRATRDGEDRMRTKATALYPFLPSGPDFRLALAFLAELGFAKQWEHGGLAGLRWGGAYFLPQDIDIPEWQKNQMITFEVDDLDAYWNEIDPKDLAGRL